MASRGGTAGAGAHRRSTATRHAHEGPLSRDVWASFGDPDPDIRYMGLGDLEAYLLDEHSSQWFAVAATASVRGPQALVSEVISLLQDTHGEVQNQALKCVGPLYQRCLAASKHYLIDQLCQLATTPETDTSIAYAGLRACLAHMRCLGSGGPEAASMIAEDLAAVRDMLLAWLTEGQRDASLAPPVPMLRRSMNPTFSSDAFDVAREAVQGFGAQLPPGQLERLTKLSLAILRQDDGTGSVTVKRALALLQQVVSQLNGDLWRLLLVELQAGFAKPHIATHRRRCLILAIGTACRGDPVKFGRCLSSLVGFVLEPLQETSTSLQDDEDEEEATRQDELKETALMTADTLLSLCPRHCEPYSGRILDAALHLVKHDPNRLDMDMDDGSDGEDSVSNDLDAMEEEEEEEEGDDDFEDLEGEGDDSDSISWTVRRAAAKLLTTILTPTATGDAHTVDSDVCSSRIAPVLLSRLRNEKEDAVKVEIVASLIALMNRLYDHEKADNELRHRAAEAATGQADIIASERLRSSRKRFRQDSDAELPDPVLSDSVSDPAEDADYEAQLAASPTAIMPDASSSQFPAPSPSDATADPSTQQSADLCRTLTDAVCHAWAGASAALRRCFLTLLRTAMVAQPSHMMQPLPQLLPLLQEAINVAADSRSSATVINAVAGAEVCCEGLGLVRSIATNALSSCATPFASAELQSDGTTLLDFCMQITPAILRSADVVYLKVACESLATLVSIEKAMISLALTTATNPPAAKSCFLQVAKQLDTAAAVLIRKAGEAMIDSEIRKQAIAALGVLLSRTIDSRAQECLSASTREHGLNAILERLKTELTKTAAIKAIDKIVLYAFAARDLPQQWVVEAAQELTAQLRKADRTLLTAALGALKTMVVNPNTRAHLTSQWETIHRLALELQPLLSTEDLHLLMPTLIIYTKVVPHHTAEVVIDPFITRVTSVARSSITGLALKSFLLLVRVISEQGFGEQLFTAFMASRSSSQDSALLGRAVGVVIVHGGDKLASHVQDVLDELASTQDDRQKCFALSVLGEVGLRLGARSPMTPELYITHFGSPSDRVRQAAAVALGRAGTSNVGVYMPVILDGLRHTDGLKYLLLHSLREILHDPVKVREGVRPFAEPLWSALFNASRLEDNRVVGAECIGRLALVEPALYMPRLEDYLSDEDTGTRDVTISAYRYSLLKQDQGYRDVMRNRLPPILRVMLRDLDIRNHTSALTTVNSAIVHQLPLVKPQLRDLLHLVMEDTHVRPELVRDVQMGPFRHRIDDGLELRKAAYEVLYATLENSASTYLDLEALFGRLLDGVSDNSDIRTLCLMMISRLIDLAPDVTRKHLTECAENFTEVLTAKRAGNAVKQDLAREQEAASGILNLTRAMDLAFPMTEGSPQWRAYVKKASTLKPA
ncbi:hypothetical protein KEM52_000928 [Ascosphaera acerosa]|nr:hypothetical protein KEM52_000928 [Ascosphaera acerosa]